MNRYDSYKDSGVEWIGEIPNIWRKLKIKHLFSHSKGKNGQKLTKEFIGNNPGEYPVYSGTTKGEGHLGKTNEYEFDTNGEEVIFVSTVGSDTTVMSTKVLSGRFNLSQNCLIMSPKFDFSTKYQYYFTTHDFPYQRTILPIVLKEGHRSVGMGELNEFTSLLPPLSEQQQIVSFLDTKTSLIDSLIEKTQRKIELLKEKRTSLINEVVTKGLNPNVEMKGSGVEWIGKIPIHWERVSLGKIGVLYGGLTGKSGDDFRSDDNPLNKPFIPFTNIFNNTYISKTHFQNVVIGDNENQNRVEKFDLFFLMSSEDYDDLGKSSILIEDVGELYLNSFCKGFRVKRKDVNPLFLNYQLLGDTHKKLISIEGNGFTRINLRQDRLKETPMFIPPPLEQQQIVEYLDEQTQRIDKTISIEKKRIELLKEYRQSLIFEVVTGKRKVVE